MWCLLDDLRASGSNVDKWTNCSPGRGGISQDGGTRDGAFHGEIDRCRESRGWTTARSSMSKRDGKRPEKESPKQAMLVLVRSP